MAAARTSLATYRDRAFTIDCVTAIGLTLYAVGTCGAEKLTLDVRLLEFAPPRPLPSGTDMARLMGKVWEDYWREAAFLGSPDKGTFQPEIFENRFRHHCDCAIADAEQRAERAAFFQTASKTDARIRLIDEELEGLNYRKAYPFAHARRLRAERDALTASKAVPA